ncbi:MAG: DeoR family transcriptional regulator [bacterium]|nr:DeoR family transcriptional regulator [bacterium]
MTEREKTLLKAIVAEHIAQSRPIGSKIIVDKYLPDVSSATIRNDMARLEEAGLIEQPHTSAGRVPTPKAYEYYVQNFLSKTQLDKSSRQKLEYVVKQHEDFDRRIRELAKLVAELSSEAVVVGFSERDVYYTGLSNLFRQPEFTTVDTVHDFTEIIDHLDDVMESIFPSVTPQIQILVGRNNPFGQSCGAIVTQYRCDGLTGMFGILGPMRMPYEKNSALLQYASQIVSK